MRKGGGLEVVYHKKGYRACCTSIVKQRVHSRGVTKLSQLSNGFSATAGAGCAGQGGGDTRNAEREGQKGGISTRLATIEYILGNTQKKIKWG